MKVNIYVPNHRYVTWEWNKHMKALTFSPGDVPVLVCIPMVRQCQICRNLGCSVRPSARSDFGRGTSGYHTATFSRLYKNSISNSNLAFCILYPRVFVAGFVIIPSRAEIPTVSRDQ
jgi:hypothetical protein